MPTIYEWGRYPWMVSLLVVTSSDEMYGGSQGVPTIHESLYRPWTVACYPWTAESKMECNIRSPKQTLLTRTYDIEKTDEQALPDKSWIINISQRPHPPHACY